jgi:phosphoserine phosphatase
MSNFVKIRPVGAELFHTDGQTDMKMLIVAFRSFAKAPKREREKEREREGGNIKLLKAIYSF